MTFDIEAGSTDSDVPSGTPKLSVQGIWYEFIGMFLFVFICCGSVAFSNPENLNNFTIALTFGLCISVLLFSTSCGQINSAVTLALMVSGDLSIVQGLCNISAQFCGATLGALLIWFMVMDWFKAGEITYTLGNNQMPEDTNLISACIGEFMGAYLLCWVFFQTAVAKESVARGEPNLNPCTAPLAIGLAVFLAHMFLLDLTSCSINLPRSFGPAIVAMIDSKQFNFDNGFNTYFWVFALMPHLAGILAGAQRRVTVLVFRNINYNAKQNSIESILAN